MTLDEMRNDYDWQEAFYYAKTIRTATGCKADGFSMADVVEILAYSIGENDGASWMMAGRLSDGRFFFLDAGCDYTGWECKAGGDAQVADTLDNIVRFGMTEEARERLGFGVPNDMYTSKVPDNTLIESPAKPEDHAAGHSGKGE